MSSYPIYKGEKRVGTIDDQARLRDLSGRFLAYNSDEADDLLAACRIVDTHRGPEVERG